MSSLSKVVDRLNEFGWTHTVEYTHSFVTLTPSQFTKAGPFTTTKFGDLVEGKYIFREELVQVHAISTFPIKWLEHIAVGSVQFQASFFSSSGKLVPRSIQFRSLNNIPVYNLVALDFNNILYYLKQCGPIPALADWRHIAAAVKDSKPHFTKELNQLFPPVSI